MIAPGHPKESQDELREERQVETQEYDHRRNLGPQGRIHSAGNLGPPEVEAPKIAHDRAPYHNVVEMRHHEVSVRKMDVHSERRQEQSGKSAHGKKSDEAHGV